MDSFRNCSLKIYINSATLFPSVSLGTWVQEHVVEIKTRIETAERIYEIMKKLLIRNDISLVLHMRLVRCYVSSVVLYGVESWTLTRGLERKLHAFELLIYRPVY